MLPRVFARVIRPADRQPDASAASTRWSLRRHRLVALSLCACLRLTAASAQQPNAPTNVRIVMNAPVVTVTPASVNIAPGASVRFAASVSGATNQAVVWTATGGTIDANGVYLAGPVGGAYTATASVAGQPSYAQATIANSGPADNTTILPGDNIQAHVDAAPAGTAFLLKAGVYRLQSVIPKAGQSFTGETGTILSGAKLLTTFTKSGSVWYADGQTQEGLAYGSVDNGICRSTSPRCGYPEDVFLNDVPLIHAASLSAGGPGRWFFDYAADRIYLWNDPTGQRVETSVTPRAFGGYASGITIRNLVIEKYAVPTQQGAAILAASGWTIENSEVRFNHYSAIAAGNASIIRNNRVHHNGCIGLVGSGTNILVEKNEIYNNNFAGYNYFWEAGGSKWVLSTGLVVRGNFSHHNDGPGLWTDVSNTNTLYEDNIVEDNVRGGIVHEISFAATLRNNAIRRNGTGKDYPFWTTGAGIEVIDSANVEIYGNTLEDNYQGITGLDDNRVDPSVHVNGDRRLTNLNVHDNAISQRQALGSGTGRTGIISQVPSVFDSSLNNRYSQNSYVLGSYSRYFMWNGAELTESDWKALGEDSSGSFER